jgi:hypothetical protein
VALNFPLLCVEYFNVFNLYRDCLLDLEHVALGHVVGVV